MEVTRDQLERPIISLLASRPIIGKVGRRGTTTLYSVLTSSSGPSIYPRAIAWLPTSYPPTHLHPVSPSGLPALPLPHHSERYLAYICLPGHHQYTAPEKTQATPPRPVTTMGQPRKPASKNTVLADYVQLSDPFPTTLLGFLEVLPDDSAPEDHATTQQQSQAAEPPRKKARRDSSSASDYVTIAEESFDIQRPCRPQQLKSQPRLAFMKLHAHGCIQLHCALPAYVPGEDVVAKELTISGQHRSSPRVKSTLVLNSSVSPKVACILRVVSRSRDGQQTEGGVWVAFDVGFERRDGMDRISLRLKLMWNPTRSIYAGLRSAQQRALSQEIHHKFFPPDMLGGTSSNGPSPQAFYEAACAPDTDYADLMSVPVPMLVSTLYPFQRRTLQWLLEREVSLSFLPLFSKLYRAFVRALCFTPFGDGPELTDTFPLGQLVQIIEQLTLRC